MTTKLIGKMRFEFLCNKCYSAFQLHQKMGTESKKTYHFMNAK
jgi:hypothetical protein